MSLCPQLRAAEAEEQPQEAPQEEVEKAEEAPEEEAAPEEQEEAPAEEEEAEEEVVDPKPDIEASCKPKCVKQLLSLQVTNTYLLPTFWDFIVS